MELGDFRFKWYLFDVWLGNLEFPQRNIHFQIRALYFDQDLMFNFWHISINLQGSILDLIITTIVKRPLFLLWSVQHTYIFGVHMHAEYYRLTIAIHPSFVLADKQTAFPKNYCWSMTDVTRIVRGVT